MLFLMLSLQIAVEGNIASGKTTLLNVFAKQYSAEVNNIVVSSPRTLPGWCLLIRAFPPFQRGCLLLINECHPGESIWGIKTWNFYKTTCLLLNYMI